MVLTMSHRKFIIKMLSDLMRLLVFESLLQSNGISQVLVEIDGTVPVLPQVVHLDVARFVAAFFADEELLLVLAVIDIVVMSQGLDHILNRTSRRGAKIVDHWLRHQIEAGVEVACEQYGQLRVIVTGVDGRVLEHELVSHGKQFLLCYFAFLGQLDVI